MPKYVHIVAHLGLDELEWRYRKADDPDNNENDADDSCWFHEVDSTKICGRRSIAE